MSMVLLHIPDEGVSYVWAPPADGTVTAITISVRQFTATYNLRHIFFIQSFLKLGCI